MVGRGKREEHNEWNETRWSPPSKPVQPDYHFFQGDKLHKRMPWTPHLCQHSSRICLQGNQRCECHPHSFVQAVHTLLTEVAMCFSAGSASWPEKSWEHMRNSSEQSVAELIARLNVCMQASDYLWIRCYLNGYCWLYPSLLYYWEVRSRNFYMGDLSTQH